MSEATSIYQRPVELLQNLLRYDTTNPPGNEAACIAYIDGLLKSLGIETILLEKAADLLKRFLNNKNIVDSRMVKGEAANYLERYFWEEIKRRPMILPVIVEV